MMFVVLLTCFVKLYAISTCIILETTRSVEMKMIAAAILMHYVKCYGPATINGNDGAR